MEKGREKEERREGRETQREKEMKREGRERCRERKEKKEGGWVGEGKMAGIFHNLDQTSQLSFLSSPRLNCWFVIANQLLKCRQVQLQIQFDA